MKAQELEQRNRDLVTQKLVEIQEQITENIAYYKNFDEENDLENIFDIVKENLNENDIKLLEEYKECFLLSTPQFAKSYFYNAVCNR